MTSIPNSALHPSSTAAPPSPVRNAAAQRPPVDDDTQNESEAETVVLDSTHDGSESRVIKTEHTNDDDDDDDDDDALHTRTQRPSRAPSPSGNGPTPSHDGIAVKVNGASHGSQRDAKSPVPTSPSSRTTSRHTKDTSPIDSIQSPALSTASPPPPPQHTGRGRSASIIDSRKRKLRDDSHPTTLGPPRQKAKTESLKDGRQPTSPATPGLGRPHKRSQSTQSLVTGAAGRRRREMTSLAVSTDRKPWSDDSSENSSSPYPAQTPNLPHARVKRSGHRALDSPARAMAHGRKVDKFGATRLARESEKGDLSSVRAAFEAAPEEMDQVDFAGFAPLQKAALHGWADIVEFLISKGCRTDCESNDRDTPLIDAVENGHLDVVKLLLNQGHVNPHHQNKKGQRAVDVLDHETDDYEAIEKELKTAMRRQSDTASRDDYVQSGLSQTKSTSRLLYNEYNTETLVEKAGDGDILAVGELINSNIKPNIACGVAASRGGHYDILSILLASGLKADPDPSKHSETPMSVAIGRGHLKIVNLLLDYDNFDPTRRNREGKTYWEISEDRRGPKWEQERDILKNAYDTYRLTHKSPRRNRKEPANLASARTKKRTSPSRREQSSSPRPEAKRAPLTKPTTVPQGPQKPRRLISAKEKASREGKRRRRVVSDESSEDDSDVEVRAPSKSKKPRALSEGQEHKPVKRIKAPLEEHDVSQQAARPFSHDSDDARHPKSGAKVRTKTDKALAAKPTPDADSPDEKRSVKSKIRSRPREDTKTGKRISSSESVDVKVKREAPASPKSTPAPFEKATTPEAGRAQAEEQKEAEKHAAEVERKAAEDAARRQDEEAARKVAEEEARQKAEAAAVAEAEARRLAEEAAAAAAAEAAAEAAAAAEAEAARKREEEERRREAEEEARRQERLAARQERILKLPRALRRACELGTDRPLHFSGEELGITAIFLPLFSTSLCELRPNVTGEASTKTYIPSFQAAGILGLRELDLAHLDAPYSDWDRVPFTSKQRDLLLRQYDVALLAQDFRFPMEGAPDFDYADIQHRIMEARQQFLSMEGLYWIEDAELVAAVQKIDALRPLREGIRDPARRRRVHLAEQEVEAVMEKKPRPRKSFMDTVLKQNRVNGVNGVAKVNGNV